MNIIFYRYKSICEPDFIDAFKSLGIEVIEDCDGITSSASLEDRISHLVELIITNKPLFVFTINYYPFISMLCEKLHVYYIAVTVDCPVFEIFNNSIINKYNRLFLFDQEQYNSIHDFNPDCIFHLPLGAATNRLSALLKNTSDYKYDISFVGSLYNEKDPLFQNDCLPNDVSEAISNSIESQISNSVYGYKTLEEIVDNDFISILKKSFPDFYPSTLSVFDISKYVALCDYLCPHATFVERLNLLNHISANCKDAQLHLFTQSNTASLSSKITIHNGVNSLYEMPFVFRQSKINLNITTRSISSGLSQRIWDVLACKGFLITNYQPEIDMFFEDGVHLVTYKSPDELIDKINYYLIHDQQRERIAQKGFDFVNENGKVVDRVISIISAVISGASSIQ